jgi:hypothetical protein
VDDVIQPAPTLAMRLIFEYEGDQVQLVSQMPVDLLITGFDLTRTQRAGYYVDTRDASGQTLARVPARNVFSTSTEVFPEQPGELITRVELPTPRGAFTVIVPAPSGADSVSLVRVAPSAIDAAQPSARAAGAAGTALATTEIARFALQISR